MSTGRKEDREPIAHDSEDPASSPVSSDGGEPTLPGESSDWAGITESFAVITDISRAAAWPGVEESLSYGTPSLKVRGKFMLRIREPGILVLRCDLDEKEFLIAAAPDIYFETNHYKGWPAVLIRLENIEREELRDQMDRAWRTLAPKKLVAAYGEPSLS